MTKFLVLFANLSTKASTQHTRQGFRGEGAILAMTPMRASKLIRVNQSFGFEVFFIKIVMLFANLSTKASTQHTRHGFRVEGAILQIKPTEFDHTSLDQKKVKER